ncbi:hypothetical protein TNCV_4671 [Trichonephila clavipes]|nr:hypothetical protein TNCV_4671 [Trichonephila clavipes]
MGHFLKSSIYCDVTGLRYIVQPCLLFTTPAFFVTLSLLSRSALFLPPSLPDPFLYIVSRSTCCQVQAAVPYRHKKDLHKTKELKHASLYTHVKLTLDRGSRVVMVANSRPEFFYTVGSSPDATKNQLWSKADARDSRQGDVGV